MASSHSNHNNSNSHHSETEDEELNYLISPQLLNHYKNNILPQCDETQIRRHDFLPHYRARSYPLYMRDNFSKICNNDSDKQDISIDINTPNSSSSSSLSPSPHDNNKSKIKPNKNNNNNNNNKPLPTTPIITNDNTNTIINDYIINEETNHKYSKVTDAFELIDDDHCIVGEGTYGVVFRAYSKPTGKDVAVKGIRCDDGYMYQLDEKQVNNNNNNLSQSNNNSNNSSSNNENNNNLSSKSDNINMDISINNSSSNNNNSKIDIDSNDNNNRNKDKYKSITAGTYSNFMTNRLALKKKLKQFNDQIGIPHTAIQELQTLQRLQHKNIVNLIDVVSNRTFDCVPCDVSSQMYLKLLRLVWQISDKYKQKYKDFILPEMPSDSDVNKEEKSRKIISKIFAELHFEDVQSLEDDIRNKLYNTSEEVHQKRCKKGQKTIPVFYMTFEFMDRDLSSLLKRFANKNVKLKECIVKYYFIQIMEGLRHCHQCGIIHRDIKPSNVLINYSGEVKLCDFGLAFENFSTHSSTIKTNRVVTSWYRPPEILLGETKYSYSIDIWSCCCVLIEMLTNISPFQGQSELDLFRQIANLCGMPNENNWTGVNRLPWYNSMMQHLNKSKPIDIKHGDVHYRYERCVLNDPFLKYHMNKHALEFVDFMLVLNPMDRPSANDVLSHPYFRNEPLPKYIKIDSFKKINMEKVDKLLQQDTIREKIIDQKKEMDKENNNNEKLKIIDENKENYNYNNKGRYSYQYRYDDSSYNNNMNNNHTNNGYNNNNNNYGNYGGNSNGYNDRYNYGYKSSRYNNNNMRGRGRGNGRYNNNDHRNNRNDRNISRNDRYSGNRSRSRTRHRSRSNNNNKSESRSRSR